MAKVKTLYDLANYSKEIYGEAEKNDVMGYIVRVTDLQFDKKMLSTLAEDGIKVGDYLVVNRNIGNKSDVKFSEDEMNLLSSNLPRGMKELDPFKEFEIYSLSAEEYNSLKKADRGISYFAGNNEKLLSNVLNERKHIVNVSIAKKIRFDKVEIMTLEKELVMENSADNNTNRKTNNTREKEYYNNYKDYNYKKYKNKSQSENDDSNAKNDGGLELE